MPDFDSMAKDPPEEQPGSSTGLTFPIVEPWPEAVDGQMLLSDIFQTIRRFVLARDETVRAAALWIVHTWMMDCLTVSPIAHITAAEKRCGKTVLLTVFGHLCRRSLQTANISTAALFRSIESWTPTLLFDEVDASLARNEEIRGIVNSGHMRCGAFVLRCVGDDHEPKRFSTWAAKALCGIGKLHDTTADRCIRFSLVRKIASETTENIRHAPESHWHSLRSRIARWVEDHRDAIETSRPVPVEGLTDRANDCWEPLLAIADEVGGTAPSVARDDALALSDREDDAPSIGTELLGDIRRVFAQKEVPNISTADLLEALSSDREARWATFNRGYPMNANQLASRLAGFDVKSQQMRIGDKNLKGYRKSWFEDAFARFLPDKKGGV